MIVTVATVGVGIGWRVFRVAVQAAVLVDSSHVRGRLRVGYEDHSHRDARLICPFRQPRNLRQLQTKLEESQVENFASALPSTTDLFLKPERRSRCSKRIAAGRQPTTFGYNTASEACRSCLDIHPVDHCDMQWVNVD